MSSELRMLFLNRAKAVCGLAGVLCLAGLMMVKRTPIVAGAVAVREADEEDACVDCHKEEVNGFARSKMPSQCDCQRMNPKESCVRCKQLSGCIRIEREHGKPWRATAIRKLTASIM
jgi:hypothetical protein